MPQQTGLQFDFCYGTPAVVAITMLVGIAAVRIGIVSIAIVETETLYKKHITVQCL